MILIVRESLRVLAGWSGRQWWITLISAVAVAALVALPTAVIPNPVFGRSMAVTWWSYPVVVLTGILGGMLIATYVRQPLSVSEDQAADDSQSERVSRWGMVGAVASFFAVGCPVCNKLVLLALGASGAVSWFAPIQPWLAVLSVLLMGIGLFLRLRNADSCRLPSRPSGAA